MWGKILIGIVVVTSLFYGLGIFLRGSSSSFVQSRVEQAYEDMREMASALERDFKKFSEGDVGEDLRFEEFEFGRADEVWPDTFAGFMNVVDPFDPEKGIYLAATLNDHFLFISPGPNKFIDVSPKLIEEAIKNDSDLVDTVEAWTYSPDNGVNSDGDLFVIQEFGS